MPLSTAERPINIKDLILEEPERTRELPFDPEKEITQEDWRDMIAGLEAERKVYNHGLSQSRFFEYLVELKLLFSDRAADLCISDELWDESQSQLASKEKEWSIFARIASEMKILFPDRFQRDPELQKEAEESCRTTLERWKSISNLDPPFNNLFALKILDPIHFVLPKNYEGVSPEDVASQLDEIRQGKNEDIRWRRIVTDAAHVKILFPGYHIVLDETDWQAIRKEFKKEREEGTWMGLTSFALNLKILVAEELRFTDNSLEIIMPKPKQGFSPPTLPMPEVRRF